MDSALCDLAAAATACVAVTPIVGAVDRAVAESAGGRVTLYSSFAATLRAVAREPHRAIFRPEMRYVAAMYGGTYIAANLLLSHEQRVSKSMPTEKTIVVGSTNTALALWKDTNLAKLLGKQGTKPPRVPPAALASWAVRDCLGMAVIFTLPPLLSPRLAEHTGLSLRQSEIYAQVLCPLAIQPVLAPFHLLGFMLVYSPEQTWVRLYFLFGCPFKTPFGTLCWPFLGRFWVLVFGYSFQ